MWIWWGSDAVDDSLDRGGLNIDQLLCADMSSYQVVKPLPLFRLPHGHIGVSMPTNCTPSSEEQTKNTHGHLLFVGLMYTVFAKYMLFLVNPPADAIKEPKRKHGRDFFIVAWIRIGSLIRPTGTASDVRDDPPQDFLRTSARPRYLLKLRLRNIDPTKCS